MMLSFKPDSGRWLGVLVLSAAQLAIAQTAPGPAASAPTLIVGTDKILATPTPYVPPAASGLSFNFEDAPVADVVRTILGDVMQANFLLHPPVAGAVTLVTRSTVSADQALYLLETALFANGLGLAKDARGTYHVGRLDVLKNVGVPVRQSVGGVLPPGVGAIVVPLKFIGAQEMAAILKPMIPADAMLRVDPLRNLLVLSGSRAQAEGWLDMVATFDIDLLKGMSVGVFPLKYLNPKDVELALRLFNPASASAAAGAPANPLVAASSSAGNAAAISRDSVTNFGGMRVIPLEQMNSVLVVASQAAQLEVARSYLEKLDKPNIGSTDQQLHIYPVQNGNAKHLAGVLMGLFGDGKAAAPTQPTGVAPGLSPTTASTARTGAGFGGAGVGSGMLGSNTSGRATGAGSSAQTTAANASTGSTAGTLLGSIRVMSDDINNMILVWGTFAEFTKIETALKRLDLPPTQVLIEASIIEVTLTDDLKYGLQWMFTDTKSSGNVGTGVISSAGGGVLGAAQAGFSYTMKNSLGQIRAVLNALATKSLVKVISSPSLMVLDNHSASISVGNQQPIKTGETTSAVVATVTSNIQYKDTGVNLTVLPSVNAGNIVTMQVDQNVTDVGAVDEATGQRAFLQRQISSKVAVRSGETIVLGGLIRDNSTTGKTGVPLLQDLPLLGNLFSTNTTNGARTELLVIITPRVVRTDFDLRSIGIELRERMQGLSGPVGAANGFLGSQKDTAADDTSTSSSINR